MQENKDPNAWHNQPASPEPQQTSHWQTQKKPEAPAQPSPAAAPAAPRSNTWAWVLIALIAVATVVICYFIVQRSNDAGDGASSVAQDSTVAETAEASPSEGTVTTTATVEGTQDNSGSDTDTDTNTNPVTTTQTTMPDGLYAYSHFQGIGDVPDDYPEVIYESFMDLYEDQGTPRLTIIGPYAFPGEKPGDIKFDIINCGGDETEVICTGQFGHQVRIW